MRAISGKFKLLPQALEIISYFGQEGKERISLLNFPAEKLKQNRNHRHLANPSISIDWQFIAELLFLEKVKHEIINR